MTTIPDRNETTEYEELCQQLNFYFSDRAIARWLTENLPEKEWLEEIAISFVHELEGYEYPEEQSENALCSYDEINDYIWGRVKDIIREENLPFPEVDAIKITNELQSALKLKEKNKELQTRLEDLDKMAQEWCAENEELKARIEELENDEDTPPDHECKTCGVECTLKDGFKWFREDDTYECATCFDEHFNLPDNENDEMTQSEYREWNRENPELQALGRQVETLEAEQKKLVAYIKEQQDHIKALSARFEAENGKFATADWDTILRSDDTNSGEAPAATQPIPIPSGRK